MSFHLQSIATSQLYPAFTAFIYLHRDPQPFHACTPDSIVSKLLRYINQSSLRRTVWLELGYPWRLQRLTNLPFPSTFLHLTDSLLHLLSLRCSVRCGGLLQVATGNTNAPTFVLLYKLQTLRERAVGRDYLLSSSTCSRLYLLHPLRSNVRMSLRPGGVSIGDLTVCRCTSESIPRRAHVSFNIPSMLILLFVPLQTCLLLELSSPSCA